MSAPTTCVPDQQTYEAGVTARALCCRVVRSPAHNREVLARFINAREQLAEQPTT
jgi:hypothetical protein